MLDPFRRRPPSPTDGRSRRRARKGRSPFACGSSSPGPRSSSSPGSSIGRRSRRRWPSSALAASLPSSASRGPIRAITAPGNSPLPSLPRVSTRGYDSCGRRRGGSRRGRSPSRFGTVPRRAVSLRRRTPFCSRRPLWPCGQKRGPRASPESKSRKGGSAARPSPGRRTCGATTRPLMWMPYRCGSTGTSRPRRCPGPSSTSSRRFPSTRRHRSCGSASRKTAKEPRSPPLPLPSGRWRVSSG